MSRSAARAKGAVVVAMAGLLFLASPAAQAKVVVLESHSMPRTARAAKMVSAVVAAIGEEAVAGTALKTKLTQVFGSVPKTLSPEMTARMLALLKMGASGAYEGAWGTAIRHLRTVRKSLNAVPLSLARKRELFLKLQRTRLLLIRCFLRTKKRELADALGEEVVRAQPDIVVSPAHYGPKLRRVIFLARRRLRKRQASALTVTSDPPGATVFLGGRYVGVTPLKLGSVLPGTYPLILLKDNKPSRVRQVNIYGAVTVRVNLALEHAMGKTRYAGIRLPESPGRDVLETKIAMDVAGQLNAAKIILIGTRRVKGREALLGKTISMDGKTAPRTAFVYTEDDVPKSKVLRGLGRFLSGFGRPGPPIVTGAAARQASLIPSGRATVDSGPDKTAPLKIAGWTLLTTGLAAAVAGGVLLGVHGRVSAPGSSTSSTFQTDTEGYVMLGIGLPVAVIGAVLVIVRHVRLVKQRREAASLMPVLQATERAAVFGLQGTF